jgi:hypothetical protein
LLLLIEIIRNAIKSSNVVKQPTTKKRKAGTNKAWHPGHDHFVSTTRQAWPFKKKIISGFSFR